MDDSSGKREFNILLLGETGAGKSTTLNALANYFAYSTFEEALKNIVDFTEMIPSNFNMPDPETKKITSINLGKTDSNERTAGKGDSATQGPVTYIFEVNDYILRIIDTPGIGDTRGKEKDTQNFDAIFDLLSTYKYLHAVVFVVKGTDARKTEFYLYCMKQLFAQLHMDICQNLFFCFTHASTSGFGPGDAFKILESALGDNMIDIDFPLIANQNCFFIDNEWYRHLVALKANYKHKDYMKLIAANYWKESTDQFEKMLQAIIQTKPYNLIGTISLYHVRKIIGQLAKPMVIVQKNTNTTIQNAESLENDLKKVSYNKNELIKKLHLPSEELQMETLITPSTICGSEKCIKVIGVKVSYQQVCHEECKCVTITPHIRGQSSIKYCSCMNTNFLERTFHAPDSTVCQKCECPWSEHMHTYVKYSTQKVDLINKEVQALLQNSNDDYNSQKIAFDIAQKLKFELQQEFTLIQEALAKFDYFLSTNAALKNNDFIDQFNGLIAEEVEKPNPNVAPLKQLMQDHIAKVESLGINNTVIHFDEILGLKKKLIELPHSGKQFRDILEKQNISRENLRKRSEKNVQIGKTKRFVKACLNFFSRQKN